MIIGVLPYADLVLLSSNSAMALLYNLFFATCLLKETFHWQYDLSAIVLIIMGVSLTILQSNKQEVELTQEEINALLRSNKSIIYYSTCMFIFLFTAFFYQWTMKKVRAFEYDAIVWKQRVNC